jgi:hypothetical protein
MGKLRLYTLVSPYLRESDFPGLLTSTFSVVENVVVQAPIPSSQETITGSWDFDTICPHPMHPSPLPDWHQVAISVMYSQTSPSLTNGRVPPPCRPALPVGSAVMAWLPWLT